MAHRLIPLTPHLFFHFTLPLSTKIRIITRNNAVIRRNTSLITRNYEGVVITLTTQLKKSQRYSQVKVHHTGINYTSCKFAAGVIIEIFDSRFSSKPLSIPLGPIQFSSKLKVHHQCC